MELSNRFVGEETTVVEIVTKVLTISKTQKLHTLFTKSGLELLIKDITNDNLLFNFILDLSDVFRLNIVDFKNPSVEDEVISAISTKIGLDKKFADQNIFDKKFLENFASVEIISEILKANRWLIVVVLFRFSNLSNLLLTPVEAVGKSSQ